MSFQVRQKFSPILPLLSLAVMTTVLFSGCVRLKSDKSSADAPASESVGESIDVAETDVEPFSVKFETSKGDILVDVHPEWAPIGAAHFRELVESGYYDDNRFFRVLPDFVVQFGLNGDPALTTKWRQTNLEDEPVRKGNTKGTLVYAMGGPNTRTTQLFINLKDNTGSLDPQGFSAFAEVVQGFDIVESINSEYGERPDQGEIMEQGNAYLNREYPNLDFIKKATIIPNETPAPATPETAAPEATPSETKPEPEAAKPEVTEKPAETPAAVPTETPTEAAPPKEVIEEVQ